jgi:hypothetical protein
LLLLLLLANADAAAAAAAAVGCCGHAPATQGPQATHHQHGHEKVVDGGENVIVANSGFDFDCGACHANCAAAVSTTNATMTISAGAEQVEHLAERRLPPWHEQPYRPQWFTPTGSGLNAVA